MSFPMRRLMIDITHTASNDYDTGIQRVARCLAQEAVAYSQKNPEAVECFPVIHVNGQFVHVDRWCAARGYRKSRWIWSTFAQNLLPSWLGTKTRLQLTRIGTRLRKLLYPRTIDRKLRQLIQAMRPQHTPVKPGPGDVILMPDSWWDLPEMFHAVGQAREHGALVGAMVHDLIPIRYPEFFNEELRVKFTSWAEQLVHSVDFFVGDARCAENDLWQFVQEQKAPLGRSQVGHVRLGCDIAPVKQAVASKTSKLVRDIFQDRRTAPYLMVSTIEIRKNHHYLLDAFDRLWQQGHDVSLALVGRIGWKCQDLVQRIADHPESGERLHLLSNVDDNTLNYIYQNSKGFLFSSKAEGFGLPIVEAQHHGLHVFASDIPIFREVAGTGARFFSLDDPSQLSQQIADFEASRGWETKPQVEVANEPWKVVFPKLVDVVARLADNAHRTKQVSTSRAA